jgi:hypothetical protein
VSRWAASHRGRLDPPDNADDQGSHDNDEDHRR